MSQQKMNIRNMVLVALTLTMIPIGYVPVALADSDHSKSEMSDGERRRMGHGRKRGGWMKDLDLSEEQREKIKAARQSHREKIVAAREKMKTAREDFQEAMKRGASNSQLKAKHEAKLSTRNEFARAQFARVLDVRAVLTEEQRKKFKGMRGERRRHHKGGKGRHRGSNQNDDND